MARPVTMFTGQWADLPLEELAKKCSDFGYDGLELACWGDHFQVDRPSRSRTIATASGKCWSATACSVWAISNHLVGQAVLDIIDARHQAILPPRRVGRRPARRGSTPAPPRR